MIRGDAEVIGHVAPLPRIELRPIWPIGQTIDPVRDEMWRLQRLAEGERILQLIREACA